MLTRNGDRILPLIGLEIHAHLSTETKLFCRCKNSFGDPPNTNVCPVCLGLPGALPVLNLKAVELAMKMGMALSCEVADFTKWDRKSYNYPDLPKNYQISQYDLPLNINGYLEIPLESTERGGISAGGRDKRGEESGKKRIRILRAHLEEDAGKNIHDNPAHTGVDLNRAGVPLLEIVSQPDMHDKEEVLAYSRSMQRIVRWIGASQANMEMGQMRFEPNINLHITRDGKTYKTPIVEVKNLNSFRALEATVTYEIDRQYEEWQEDPSGYCFEKLGKQNRGFDAEAGVTVFQREKEEAHDYRYFPDPDLVPVLVDNAWRERIRESIGVLPAEKTRLYQNKYGFSEREASFITSERALSDLLDRAITEKGAAQQCVRLLMGKGSALAKQRNCAVAAIGIGAGQLAELSSMLAQGKILGNSAAKIFEKLTVTVGSPLEMAEKEGLLIKSDLLAIQSWIKEVLTEHPKARDDVISGGKNQKKAFGFLIGKVLQKSGGTAPPQEVRRLLEEALRQPQS